MNAISTSQSGSFLGLNLRKLLLNRWFLAILAAKIALSLFFAADVLVKGFSPFVNFFVLSGFQNPYEHFLAMAEPKAFPYQAMMLWILTIPKAVFFFLLHADYTGFIDVFLTRVPVLLADILIYIILCKWLETKENKVLIFYWASPILIYINYFHGQLDVIPTAVLVLALALLFIRKELIAYLILGLGLAIKSHLLAALPLFALYQFVNKVSLRRILILVISSLAVFALFTFPYLPSSAYQEMVLNASEQKRIFLLSFPYYFDNINLVIAPGIYLMFLLMFLSYKKINQDMLIIITGLVFSVLVILVPPMPGWFYWSVPFLAYFYIKNTEAPSINFWLLNAFYLLYFIFQKDSTFFQSFQFISPQLATMPTAYDMVAGIGRNADLVANLFFTGLQVSMAVNLLWCYKTGIRSNFEYKLKDKAILIGVGGDSGAGKSTFAETLEKLFNKDNTVCVNGDDVHKWPRGHEKWEVFTHLNPKSNHLHTELNHAIALKNGRFVERVHYDHNTGTFTDSMKLEPNKFVLFVGLHPYFIKGMRDIFDIKIFIDPDEALRKHWKILRDMQERSYSKEKVLSQLEKREEDSKKYIKPQKEMADIIFSYLPVNPISDLGSSLEEVKIKLRVCCDNSVFIDPLIDALSQVPTMRVASWNEDDLVHQCIEIEGLISASEIMNIAYQLVPNLKELLHNESPEWLDNYQGISQLMLLYYLSEISKFKAHTNE